MRQAKELRDIKSQKTGVLADYSRETQVVESLIANPIGLVCVLLSGLDKKLFQAAKCSDEQRLIEMGFHLGRASAIIDELRSRLNFVEGGETAMEMDRYYQHLDLLVQIAATNSDAISEEAIKESREIVGNLKAAWSDLLPEQDQQKLKVMATDRKAA